MARIVNKKSAPQPAASEPDKWGGNACRESISVSVNGVRVEVTPELEAAVRRAHQASMRALPAEMTTTEAAEFLDVSRPFVIKLTRRGELPCRLVGKHRRIPTDALVAYREKMFQQASQAADEMSRLAQDAGLYDERHKGSPE